MTHPPTRELLSLYRKFLWKFLRVNELYARYRVAYRREGDFLRAACSPEIRSPAG